MYVLTSKCHWNWASILVVGRFFNETDDAVWSSVVDDPLVGLVKVVKLEWWGVGVVDDDDVVEIIDFVVVDDDDGSLTRERKLRNVDNGEEECVKIDEEDDLDEHNDWDECDGKSSWWWWWWWWWFVGFLRLRKLRIAIPDGEVSGNEWRKLFADGVSKHCSSSSSSLLSSSSSSSSSSSLPVNVLSVKINGDTGADAVVESGKDP